MSRRYILQLGDPKGFERLEVRGVMRLGPTLFAGCKTRAAMITLEDGDCAFRVDGGDPREGHKIMASDCRIIVGNKAVKGFRIIDLAGEPVLQVTYFY